MPKNEPIQIQIPYKEYIRDKFHIHILQNQLSEFIERKDYSGLMKKLYEQAVKEAKKKCKSDNKEMRKRIKDKADVQGA